MVGGKYHLTRTHLGRGEIPDNIALFHRCSYIASRSPLLAQQWRMTLNIENICEDLGEDSEHTQELTESHSHRKVCVQIKPKKVFPVSFPMCTGPYKSIVVSFE